MIIDAGERLGFGARSIRTSLLTLSLHLKQDFLGTKALVRFPVDCCTSDSRSRSLSTSTAGTLSPQSDNAPLPAMQDITSGLTVHTAGNLVPQSAIVELSLISKTAKFDRIAAYDQVSLRRASFAGAER